MFHIIILVYVKILTVLASIFIFFFKLADAIKPYPAETEAD